MSVKFNTSTLKDNEYATYNLNNFNGVDYTDSPTNVDDSRAIDISNYLPDGNSLYKRHGWEKIEYNFYADYEIANVFRLKDKYVFLGRYKPNKKQCMFFMADDLNYTNGHKLSKGIGLITLFEISEDYNGWAIEKDNMLFVFTGVKYLRIFYTTIDNGFGSTWEGYVVREVSDNAYIPTIAIGVQDELSSASSTCSYEQFNMLSNKAKIEIYIDYSKGDFKETSTSGQYNWEWNGTFDLSHYFGEYNNLILEKTNNSVPTVLPENPSENQDTFQVVGLLDPNNSAQNKVAFFKLNGYKLNLSVYAAESANLDGTVNKTIFTEADKAKGIDGIKKIVLLFSYTNTNGIETINKMRFGFLYGTNNYRDTLFATGNADYPNMDVHTCTPKEQGLEDWVSYTYFGDMTYHRIGSSSSAIIGYGINNDSSLMIIKESLANEPNVYIRTATSKIETKTIKLSGDIADFTYEDVYTLYQVFPSAINIKCNTREQVVQFDNKVMVNGKFGIYYINVNSSTAESSYDGVEASYFIRNDLDDDISDSCIIEYKDKLYVQRKSKNGKNRVYICDKNRYSYHNSKLIYEWWVLDDIPVEKFLAIDNELYFLKSGSLYKFTNNYYDLDKYRFNGINISVGDNSESMVTDLFFDYAKNEMIITSTNEFIVACKNSPTPKEDYQEFRDKTTVELGNKIYWVLDDLLDLEQEGFIMKPNVASANVINTILYFLEENDYKYYVNGIEYQLDGNYEYVYDNLTLKGVTFTNAATETEETISVSENATLMIPIASGTKFGLSNLNNGTYDIEELIYNRTWLHIANGVYDDLGTNVAFNHFKLAYNGIEINFALDTNYISSAKLEFKKAVNSFWVSNYNSLGKLDYLKTATNIYFVPDARRGGYTHVGYRTYKKDVGFYTNAKGDTFDFNDINFDDFSFSQPEFGRTYSSKKKIKNFSFIQLKFYSYDETDSTLVACTFRYKYSKNNKGVK